MGTCWNFLPDDVADDVIGKDDMAADMQSGADVTDSANVSPWVVLGDVALTITGMSRVN